HVANGEYAGAVYPDGPRELRELIGSFNEMAARLQSEDQRKRRLMADISHELRSPLGRLRALGETIVRDPDGAAPHLKQLQSEITLMDRLIDDMLLLAKLELGIGPLAPLELSLKEWAVLAFASMRTRIEQAGVRCDVAMQGTETVIASFDPDRMTQVLGNLVDNALAAVHGRGQPWISLGLSVSGKAWRMEVADNGHGIAVEDLPHIFQRSYSARRAQDAANLGLGLSIARAIVESHGGLIDAESHAGQGARISLVIPLRSG
ncbi:MAG: ATP-binding protein, partial [Gammaproteobacteria bacterium]